MSFNSKIKSFQLTSPNLLSWNQNCLGFLRSCLRDRVPAKTVIVINTTKPPIPRNYSAWAEPLSHSEYLNSNIVVVRAFVQFNKGYFFLRFANIDNSGFHLKHVSLFYIKEKKLSMKSMIIGNFPNVAQYRKYRKPTFL